MHRLGDCRLLCLVKAGPDRLQAGAEQGGNQAINQFVLAPELIDILQLAQQILQIRHVEACQRVFQFDLHDRSLEKSSYVLENCYPLAAPFSTHYLVTCTARWLLSLKFFMRSYPK
jgi:hypothetical protein